MRPSRAADAFEARQGPVDTAYADDAYNFPELVKGTNGSTGKPALAPKG